MSIFKPVEFELPADPGIPPKPKVVTFDKDMVKEAADKIRQEFERIKGGTSEFTTYAINPGPFGFPCANRLKMFEADPTEKNLKAVYEIVLQDLGMRMAVFVSGLLEATKGGNNGADSNAS